MQIVQEVLDATIDTSAGGGQRRVGRKWYFEKLDLHGVRLNLTLVPHGGYRDSDSAGAAAAASWYRMASTLGIHIIEINSVPLRVNALQLKNLFVTPRALFSQLLRHLFFQVPLCLQPSLPDSSWPYSILAEQLHHSWVLLA